MADEDQAHRRLHVCAIALAASSAETSASDRPHSRSTSRLLLAGRGRRTPQRGRRALETRRGARVSQPVELGIGAARAHLRMFGRFVDGQHRREAGVAPGGRRNPFVARARPENRGEALRAFRAMRRGRSDRAGLAVEPHHAQQSRIELRFDRADRDIFAVLGLIAAVERRAAVDDVVAALLRPGSLLPERLESRHQMSHAIQHRDVDSLALSRIARLERGRQQADGQIERAAAEVRHQIERRRRRPVRRRPCCAARRSARDS